MTNRGVVLCNFVVPYKGKHVVEPLRVRFGETGTVKISKFLLPTETSTKETRHLP